MAEHMRRSRTLLAVLAAYALALQAVLSAGLAAAQPLDLSGLAALCAPGPVRDGVNVTADALPQGSPPASDHGACCCLAATGGAPATPMSPISASLLRPAEASALVFASGEGARLAPFDARPAARPRAPPAA